MQRGWPCVGAGRGESSKLGGGRCGRWSEREREPMQAHIQVQSDFASPLAAPPPPRDSRRHYTQTDRQADRQSERRITMFLKRFAGPMLAQVKASTGIVGLDVVPNAREALITLYQQTLQAVQPIPDSAQYRKSVEALTNYRLKVCEEEEDWQNIEKRIQGGQVEELIVQAKDELQLIPKMAEWKPWEVPEGYKVEVIEDDDSIPSHVPIHKQR